MKQTRLCDLTKVEKRNAIVGSHFDADGVFHEVTKERIDGHFLRTSCYFLLVPSDSTVRLSKVACE